MQLWYSQLPWAWERAPGEEESAHGITSQKNTRLKWQAKRIQAEQSISVESYPALSPTAQHHLQMNQPVHKENQIKQKEDGALNSPTNKGLGCGERNFQKLLKPSYFHKSHTNSSSKQAGQCSCHPKALWGCVWELGNCPTFLNSVSGIADFLLSNSPPPPPPPWPKVRMNEWKFNRRVSTEQKSF